MDHDKESTTESTEDTEHYCFFCALCGSKPFQEIIKSPNIWEILLTSGLGTRSTYATYATYATYRGQ